MTHSPSPSSPSPKVVIIGAGIAGLCAGVFAKNSGLDVEILEMSDSSGGLATSWKRHDYTFETCLYWLLGSNPQSSFHALWREVFDIDQLTFIDADEVQRFETEDGQSATLRANVDLMEQELLRMAPEDRRPIRRFAQGVRRLAGFEIPIARDGWVRSLGPLLRAIPYLPELRFWSRLTAQEFSTQFRHPLLRELFGGGAQGEISAAAIVFSVAWATRKDAGYPIGGSQAVIKRIEQRFRSLGGGIRFNARVDRILVENGRAVGVQLAHDEEVRADWVISAADGHATLFEWIPEQYRDAQAGEPYETLPTFPSYVQVSLGVKRDLRAEPASFTRVLDVPLAIDPQTQLRHVAFRVFHFDPTFAPPGKTAVTCFLPTYNYEYWQHLHQSDPAAYTTKKRAIADAVIAVLERRIPSIGTDIEEIDVSTPVSVIRHTGNWKGSMEGFLLTPKTGFKPLRGHLPRLKNFLMIGQWVMPGGGLPSGLMTGRDAIRTMCRAVHRPFAERRTGS